MTPPKQDPLREPVPTTRPAALASAMPGVAGEGDELVARARRPLAATALTMISLMNAGFVGVVAALLSRPWVGFAVGLVTLAIEAAVVRRLKARFEAAVAAAALQEADRAAAARQALAAPQVRPAPAGTETSA